MIVFGQVATLASKEFRDRLRNRWVLAVALVFAVFSLVIAYAGGAQQGTVGLRSLEFTVTSLVSLVIYLVPLIALLLGFDAIVGERERGSLVRRQAQQRRGVPGDPHRPPTRPRPRLAAQRSQRDAGPQQRPRGGGAQGDDGLRLHQLYLAQQPRAAGHHFALRRCLVQAALAAQLVLEVAHGVGQIELGAVDAGLGQGLVEQLAGGADERQAGQVLAVAGLLADQHQRRPQRAGA